MIDADGNFDITKVAVGFESLETESFRRFLMNDDPFNVLSEGAAYETLGLDAIKVTRHNTYTRFQPCCWLIMGTTNRR